MMKYSLVFLEKKNDCEFYADGEIKVNFKTKSKKSTLLINLLKCQFKEQVFSLYIDVRGC